MTSVVFHQKPYNIQDNVISSPTATHWNGKGRWKLKAGGANILDRTFPCHYMSQEANKQSGHLKLSDYRRPWIPGHRVLKLRSVQFWILNFFIEIDLIKLCYFFEYVLQGAISKNKINPNQFSGLGVKSSLCPSLESNLSQYWIHHPRYRIYDISMDYYKM